MPVGLVMANEVNAETSHGWTPSSAKVDFSCLWMTLSTESELFGNPVVLAFILESVAAVDLVSLLAVFVFRSSSFGDNFLRFLGLSNQASASSSEVILEESELDNALSTEEGVDGGILKHLDTRVLPSRRRDSHRGFEGTDPRSQFPLTLKLQCERNLSPPY
jgi:hypothetical protein